jgi:hypothetical protein
VTLVSTTLLERNTWIRKQNVIETERETNLERVMVYTMAYTMKLSSMAPITIRIDPPMRAV